MVDLPPLYLHQGYLARWIDGKNKFEHIRIAELALGRPLPKGAQVHHADGDRTNNSPGNLVICPSQAYHLLLHKRQEALTSSGHPDWLKCCYCKAWDDPLNLYVGPATQYHRKCGREYRQKQRTKGLRHE